MNHLPLFAGVLLVLFGVGCLNYTKASGLDHHRAFAREHGLPAPSESILFGGAGSLVLGAGMIGYGLGASRSLANAK